MTEEKPLLTKLSFSLPCRSLRKKSQEVDIQLVLTMDEVHKYQPSSSSSIVFLSSLAQLANRSSTIIHHCLYFSQDLVSLLCLIFGAVWTDTPLSILLPSSLR